MGVLQIMQILSFVIFGVNSVLHLFWKKYGNITKAIILPSVILCYVFTAEVISPLIVISAVFSCLGDILLEKNGMKWFIAGGVSFMLSLILYGVSYLPEITFSAVNPHVLIAIALCYYGFAAFTVFSIRKTAPSKTPGLLYLYLFVNASMNILAFALLLCNLNVYGIMIFAGALMFFTSDNLLFFECFHAKKPNLFLPVMGTYIAGEFLIVIGSAMLK